MAPPGNGTRQWNSLVKWLGTDFASAMALEMELAAGAASLDDKAKAGARTPKLRPDVGVSG
jgi:hypothetical protein